MPPDLAAVTANIIEDENVILEWAHEGSKPIDGNDFFLATIDAGGQFVICEYEGLNSAAGRRVAILISPPILTRSDGREMDLLVTPRSTHEQQLSFYFPRNFTVPAAP